VQIPVNHWFFGSWNSYFSSLSVDDWPDYDVWHEFEMDAEARSDKGRNSCVGGVILLVLALVKVL
jgi:hypothetical protein